MPFTPNPLDPVGSGSPYYGSGFTSLDRYLNPQSVGWGGRQPSYYTQGNDWEVGPAYHNWLIDVSGQAGFPKPQKEAAPVQVTTAPQVQEQQPTYEDVPETKDWSNLDAHVDRAHENNPWWDEETGNYYGYGRGRRESDSGAGAGYRDW